LLEHVEHEVGVITFDIEAGGIRSSAPLSSRTAPVSASMIIA